MHEWSNYFKNLLNNDSALNGNTHIHISPADTELPISTSNFSLEEVIKGVNTMKKGKTAGNDVITSELLQYGRNTTMEQLRDICNKVLNEESLLAQWPNNVILFIPKKAIKPNDKL